MDALTLLQNDHKTVHGLFVKFGKTKATSLKTRNNIVKKIQKELEVHATVEEKLFYPALEEHRLTHDITFEAYEEHALVKILVKELYDEKLNSDEWRAKVKVLSDLVEHHVQEEEKQLFPKVRKVMPKEWLENLGVEIAKLKKKLK